MTPGSGFEPGPHCWEASALTTAPPLLSLANPLLSLKELRKKRLQVRPLLGHYRHF